MSLSDWIILRKRKYLVVGNMNENLIVSQLTPGNFSLSFRNKVDIEIKLN